MYKLEIAQISFSSQNIAPVWILVLLAKMGIQIPKEAAHSILEQQQTWEDRDIIWISSTEVSVLLHKILYEVDKTYLK